MKERLTKEEKQFITENYQIVSLDDISSTLCRSIELIKEQIEKIESKKIKLGNRNKSSALKDTHHWEKTKQSLFNDEIKYFERQWEAYVEQFGGVGEILPTDENMITDLILFDVFSQRASIAKKQALERIDSLKQDIQKENEKDRDDRDRDLISRLHEQLNNLRASLIDLTKEYIEYQSKKDNKLKDLKATRDQRFKQQIESKRDFFELLKELDTQKSRIKEGKFAEKIKLAAQKITHDFQMSHKYEDGQYDSPFLIAEEVEDPIQENKENNNE
jgi:hypothetical protein